MSRTQSLRDCLHAVAQACVAMLGTTPLPASAFIATTAAVPRVNEHAAAAAQRLPKRTCRGAAATVGWRCRWAEGRRRATQASQLEASTNVAGRGPAGLNSDPPTAPVGVSISFWPGCHLFTTVPPASMSLACTFTQPMLLFRQHLNRCRARRSTRGVC